LTAPSSYTLAASAIVGDRYLDNAGTFSPSEKHRQELTLIEAEVPDAPPARRA
jgi:hypothetical protein